MAFIGYNPDECNQLQYDITNAKNFLLSDMNELNDLIDDIEASWHGVDADKFINEFIIACNKAREVVEEAYDEMGKYFKWTADEWAAKQRTTSSTYAHTNGNRIDLIQ